MGGLPLPHEPPPMSTRVRLQELAGLRPMPRVPSEPPLTADAVSQVPAMSRDALMTIGAWRDFIRVHPDATLLPTFEQDMQLPTKSVWLGGPWKALHEQPEQPGMVGTPAGLCWSTRGGQAAAMLLALLGRPECTGERALTEDFQDWALDGFSETSTVLLDLGERLEMARERMRLLTGEHEHAGVMVARLAHDALGNRRWSPAWVSWMQRNARGAWLLVSSGLRQVAWPEVALARSRMLWEVANPFWWL